MRASRIAKETSRFFDSSPTTDLPRRSTRASLARFAHNNNTNGDTELPDSEVTLGSDIEDAITTTARKRKRTATITQSTPRRATRATKTEEVKTEVKTEVKSEADSDVDTASSKPRGRVRKPARKTTDPSTGTTTVSPPTDWEEMYNLVKEMRLTGPAANAAVDTMGCERLAAPNASARDRRFHTLVALMLSSQTKDTVNAEAMARLQNELPPCEPGKPGGLNLENMLAVEPAVLNELIGKVGFHNNKTKYLKQTASLLATNFSSDIPTTIADLCSLPGVGPKMAHLCMSAEHGWNRVEGIGVDVHVHRITNLWGWNGTTPTKTPEDTRKALESWLPREKWKEINWLLVGFGQKVCLPVGRKCGDCELGLRGMCKAAERKKVVEGRRRREVLVKREVKEEVEMKEEGEGDDSGVLVKREREAEGEMEVKGEVKEEGKAEGDGGVLVKKEVKEEEEVVKEEKVVRDVVVNQEVPEPKKEEDPVKVKMEED